MIREPYVKIVGNRDNLIRETQVVYRWVVTMIKDNKRWLAEKRSAEFTYGSRREAQHKLNCIRRNPKISPRDLTHSYGDANLMNVKMVACNGNREPLEYRVWN